MVILGFKSSKDVETPEKINCQLIIAKIGQIGLEKVLRPNFSQLLEQTVNTAKFVQILLQMNVMTEKQIEESLSKSTTFFKNLEVYQAVLKKNAGEALVDALYETENFHILQLLQSNADEGESTIFQLPLKSDQFINALNFQTEEIKQRPPFLVSIDSELQFKSGSNQVSVLQSAYKVKEINASTKWMDELGYESWLELGESTLDWTLARVAIGDKDSDSDTRESRKVFQSREFHPEEDFAIPKFLEDQLCYEIEKKIMIIAPREIYLNTRSFTSVQWNWLSKLLYSFGGDPGLEKVWLDQVNYEEFSRGTIWMKTLSTVEESRLRFPKLKAYTFLGSFLMLDEKTLNNILLLIKSADYPLNNWRSKLEMRSTSRASCFLSMHPPKERPSYGGTSKDVSKVLANVEFSRAREQFGKLLFLLGMTVFVGFIFVMSKVAIEEEKKKHQH